MTKEVKHISVCICTFKRPGLLKKLLVGLNRQNSEGMFSYSVVVVDNDKNQSAKHVVSEFVNYTSIPVSYFVEVQQNIALARNKAIDNAYGDFVAFIDDDECPEPNWLCMLFKTCQTSGADGVLGPVIPCFEQKPPTWARKGKFFERAAHETGYKIKLSDARTGNVLFRRTIIDRVEPLFKTEFGTGGEDVDFFHRMMIRGCVFVWCNEAVVYESVPPTRCTRSYLLRRALHGGVNSLKFRVGRVRGVCKSFVAVPVYGFVLPFMFIAGEHYFLKYLLKFCAHFGKLLALFCIQPFKEYK